MAGKQSVSGIGLYAVWTAALGAGAVDACVTQSIGRAGIYLLGVAVALTLQRIQRRSVREMQEMFRGSVVAAYEKGREHQDDDLAPVVPLRKV